MVHRPRPPLPGPHERGPRRRLPVRREVPKLTERSSAGQARLPAVFDTGPIIYFDFLEYLPLLGSHFRVIIPDAVARELARRPGTPGSGAPSLRFVEVLAPDPEDVRHVVSGPPPIDAGERDVIALAFGRSATAVIDDRLGRVRGRRIGVDLTGSVGVLEALHRANVAPAGRTFAEDLDAMRAAGMYLSDALREYALKRFRESIGKQ